MGDGAPGAFYDDLPRRKAAHLHFPGRMALADPKLVNAQAVITFANPVMRDATRDEMLVGALHAEFGNTVSRPMAALSGAQPSSSPLVLASSSSQVSISPAQADFAVGFYGELQTDLDAALAFLERKLSTIRVALDGAQIDVLVVGVILTLQYSLGTQTPGEPVERLFQHLQSGVPPEDVSDAQIRVGLKVADTYYVTLTLGNYEARTIQRAAIPGVVVSIRPWEGDVSDTGLQLSIDVNNRLEARQAAADEVVSAERLEGIFRVLGSVARTTGPEFIETGAISGEAIASAAGVLE